MLSKLFKYLVVIIIFLLAFQDIALSANDETWTAWRGNSKQGISESISAPVVWDTINNVQWKTKIPGIGHSSPIANQKSIFVTTVYKGSQNSNLKDIIHYLILFIFVIFGCVLIYYLIKSISQKKAFSLSDYGNIFLVSMLSGLISLSYYQINISDLVLKRDHISSIDTWLFSGIFVFLFVIIESLLVKDIGYKRKLIALLTLGFSLFVLFERPFGKYYELWGDGSHVIYTWSVAIVTMIIAISLFFSSFRKNTLKINNDEKVVDISKGDWLARSIMAIGAFMFGFGSIFFYRLIRYSNLEGSETDLIIDLFHRDNRVFALLVIIALIIWLFRWFISRIQYKIILPPIFSFLFLLLPILIFVDLNYLQKDSEYKQAVISVDRDNGDINWISENSFENLVHLHPDNSYATPTPMLDEERVYAYFGTAGLFCFDFDGEKVWDRKDIIYEGIHGIGASPMLENDCIIILNDMAESPYLLAIDKYTGKNIWKVDREIWPGIHGAHRTPTITKINNKKVILAWGVYGLQIYNFENGKQLYDIPIKHKYAELVASVITINDTLFLPNNGVCYAIDLKDVNNDSIPFIWIKKMKRKGPNCSSPVSYGNFIFMVSDNGFASCMDVRNGDIKWQKKLSNKTYYSSPIIVNDKVYFFNSEGVTSILACDTIFNKVAENSIDEKIFSSPMVINEKLIIRSENHLWCISE